MKILVRLPNWLGDMVMSIGFINALQQVYPGAEISVIAKKGIHTLLEFFPPLSDSFVFSKDEFPGTMGAWRFGRMLREKGKFELFFCLPDSFSSALMGFAAGAKKRIGYGKEMRGLLLTDTFEKPRLLHRVDEYTSLLEQFSHEKISVGQIRLHVNPGQQNDYILVNINSEASSRRLPVEKAASLITALHQCSGATTVLIGGKNDVTHTEQVLEMLPQKEKVINLVGKTSLKELVELMASCSVVLTTDSGPAHLANASGTFTVVLFGAGNELNTAPYNSSNRCIVRLGQLPCEPCVKNTCVLYGVPKCLELLDEKLVVEKVLANYNR